MEFMVKTNPPKAVTPPAMADGKGEKIKSLLFSAVSLYVENDEAARQELLELLAPGGAPDGALAS